MDVDIEIKAGAENVFTQNPILAGLVDGFLHPFEGELIFAAYINVTFVRADRISGNQHSLDDGEGVSFKDDTVFKGSGFAFICIANDIFLCARRFADRFPLNSSRKTSPTATA